MSSSKKEKEAILNHLKKYDNNADKAFTTKTLKDDPVILNDEPLKEVRVFEEIFTIRKDLNPENFKTLKHIDKVVDEGVKEAMKKRLAEHKGDFKTAFSDLEKHPIWLNEAKGISIKRATITGVSNAEPLHYAKNHLGNLIYDDLGKEIPVDFASTGNNHHVAIYQSESGELDDEVVSFYEAVIRKNQKLPIVKSQSKQGWPLKFTLKQNEMFVFPSEGFDPNEIDLMDENNQSQISNHLYRVQKLSKVEYGKSAVRDFVFRHHLETEVVDIKEMKDISWKAIKSLGHLQDIIKVRTNHLGQIVQIGEY